MGIFQTLFKKKANVRINRIEEDALTIESLFEELNQLFTKKQRVKEYLSDLNHREEQIKKFDALEKKDIEKLSALSSKAKDIEEKKQNLRGRLIKNNKSLFIISQYESEMPEMMQEMQLSENKKKESERNLYYLEEEKEALLEEREALIGGYSFLKGFSVFFMVVMGISLLITFGLMQKLREEIWVYLSGFGCALLLFVGGMLYAKDRIEKELARNTLLQQKAVRYINKFKIRYFHQVRYLTFQYEKLGVDSAAKLEMYYNRYLKNKDNEKTYSNFNHILSDIEEDMLEIMKGKGIELDYVENLTEWIMTNKKVNSLKSLEEDRVKTKEQLQALETYEEDLWKEVFVLQEDEELKDMLQYKIEQYNRFTNQSLDKSTKDA